MRAGRYGRTSLSRLLRLLALAYLPLVGRHRSLGTGATGGTGSPERRRTASLLA